jgi:hypothetical protein|tara:strand:- start:2134 stop:2313 length:180 start_codon:yes stop_codon:yes gene_type:complete
MEHYDNLMLDEYILTLKQLEKDFRTNNSQESLTILLDMVRDIEVPELVDSIVPTHEAKA